MATNPNWVLSCKKCHAECVYADIPADTESYFLPKKPQVPANFTHKCESCGHEDTYQRNDLAYRDETMRSRTKVKKCVEGSGADNKSFGAANR
jgi:hypothetical protein